MVYYNLPLVSALGVSCTREINCRITRPAMKNYDLDFFAPKQNHNYYVKIKFFARSCQNK